MGLWRYVARIAIGGRGMSRLGQNGSLGRALGLVSVGGLALLLALAGCQIDGGQKLEPVGEARVDVEHAICLGNGGEFVREGDSKSFYCRTTPKDAGKFCSKAGDCEGSCLARSKTCAPTKPLFGCNEVLTEGGFAVTECIE